MHFNLMLAARKELALKFEEKYQIAYENVPFTPPENGDTWISFHYMEASSDFVSLSRKCREFTGMVQINVVFAPNTGTDKARLIAKEIADFFSDGKILETGYISEGASIHPLQKSEAGWMIPVRFYVKTYENKGD